MKKKMIPFYAVLMAAAVTTGSAGIHVLAEQTQQVETAGGIRAAAPQGSKQQTATDTASETETQLSQTASGTQLLSDRLALLEEAQRAAAETAIADAGLPLEELTGFRIRKEREDGRTVYEVELYADEKEYSYEIDAKTAEILEQDYDVEKDYLRTPENPEALTKEEAARIVLDKVEGATTLDLRIRYEYDDHMELYEGDLVYDGTEYEFELNALDGQIMEWSKETY